ncbi:MAG TPA: NAD(P)/FAD-dependent oxidoreductase [Rhodothermales bacterium]|nr:NAD(P)/FAD-dependent oxidoreductase [Rhodothermales bacterium]
MNRRQFLVQSAASACILPFAGWQTAFIPKRKEVIILGAGLSGLYAALLLQESGYTVTVLEGKDRIGGKVFTLNHLTGKPEGGGWTIGDHYARFRSLVERFKLNLLELPVVAGPPGTLFFVNGQRVALRDWSMAKPNQLSDGERQTPPPALLGKFIRSHNPLQHARDWFDNPHPDLDISIETFLRKQKASKEALRLMRVAPNTNDLHKTSLLWAMRDDERRKRHSGDRFYRIEGGNSRLISALATSLNHPVMLNKIVQKIQQSEGKVSITCTDGSVSKADYIISTLPFSVMRGLDIKPVPPVLQAEAIQHLPYTAITQVYLQVEQPFWADDDFPVAMWTDTAIERVLPITNEKGQISMLVVWMDGKNALAFDKLQPEKQSRQVIDTIGAIRPATRDALTVVHTQRWARNPFSLGAYSHFAPGQITRFARHIAQPIGALHLAGEHTAIESPGMEGALESAERVVRELMNAG